MCSRATGRWPSGSSSVCSPAGPDPELAGEQAAVLLTYLSGLVFGFANGASEPATRIHIECQLRSVITGVAVEWGNAHAPISDSTGVRAK